ncbi:DUF5995 family protein [Zunongwangia sp. F363]|uniref:DUF5995 family protein n=1 Tax=Autumnicola tepida TaxID=3075595 RepID=A0ABU3CAW7_9FLAO|nr:DUF5995 family protein [Zunongwangia sp. F363]MDT0643490.1 DUF5995 family protein [Zunongwangia sp. F363]
MRKLKTIEDVLAELDEIIKISEEKNDPLGYFAVLYRRVTWKVKEGISLNQFDDGVRMEQLDIIFAKRYLDAYYNRSSGNISQSWEKAFALSRNYWPVILQHLLIGINAHINLDLGIAAAQVSRQRQMLHLEHDFNRINAILASLVEEVQQNMSSIWPPLKRILLKTGEYDNLLVDFSMRIARDGAWRFANTLAATPEKGWKECIAIRESRGGKIWFN